MSNVANAIVGVVIIILGCIAGIYTKTQSYAFGLYSTTSTPYSLFSIPLIIAGIFLIIISYYRESIGKK